MMMPEPTAPSAGALREHVAFLEEKVFQVHTKWPHYRRLLADLKELADTLPIGSRVAILERAFIFGSRSLFAPLFPRLDAVSIDIRLEGLEEERMGYQTHWLEDPRCAATPVVQSAFMSALPFEDASLDAVMVPNVVHHIRDQDAMFSEIARVLKPGGRGFIFETLLRELHQAPHDFVRWTPWGFEDRLGAAGLTLTEWRPSGGPFEAIAYCWFQAVQYLPEPLRTERTEWLEREHFPELMALNESFPDNRARAHTSFPIAYGIHFERPGSADPA